MKFGHVLKSGLDDSPEMSELFNSYKNLKKQVKLLPKKEEGASGVVGGPAISQQQYDGSEAEQRFVAELKRTVQRMNDIFLENEENSVIKLGNLEAALASTPQVGRRIVYATSMYYSVLQCQRTWQPVMQRLFSWPHLAPNLCWLAPA